jgi:hypothetical protein
MVARCSWWGAVALRAVQRTVCYFFRVYYQQCLRCGVLCCCRRNVFSPSAAGFVMAHHGDCRGLAVVPRRNSSQQQRPVHLPFICNCTALRTTASALLTFLTTPTCSAAFSRISEPSTHPQLRPGSAASLHLPTCRLERSRDNGQELPAPGSPSSSWCYLV